MFLSTFEHVWSSHARLEDGSLELKELSRSHVRAVPCSCVWHPMAGVKKCYGMLWVTLKEYYWVWARLTESTSMDFVLIFWWILVDSWCMNHPISLPGALRHGLPGWFSIVAIPWKKCCHHLSPEQSSYRSIWGCLSIGKQPFWLFTLWLWLTVCHGTV